MPVNIFFCYAHEDEAFLKKLKAHLMPLHRQGLIDIWHDRDIHAGTDWEKESSKYFNEAQIILLLVSPDFINSDYCYSIEMKWVLERHERGEMCVIPIILRPIYWQGLLGKLQALPKDGKPVVDRSWHRLDQAFLDITQGIRSVIEKQITKSAQISIQPIRQPDTAQVSGVADISTDRELAPPIQLGGAFQNHSMASFPFQLASIDERIQVTLRNNAVIDHLHLFGVEKLIDKIKEDFISPSGGWIISLFGEGGLGKTALAYEIVARYAASAGFTRVAWVSAKAVQLLPNGLLLRNSSAELHWTNLVKKLADQLHIEIGDNSSRWINDFQRGIRALSPNEKCLLIVDNLETVDDVGDAIHYLFGNQIIKPHKIIVTTRSSLLGKLHYLVEKQVKGLDLQPALSFIRYLGNEDIEQASDDELKPIIDATEGNPLLIKLFVTRFLTTHLPLTLVLKELQGIHERIGKNIVDYLYTESLEVLEQRCGEGNARAIMNAFCPLSAGDSVDYKSLQIYSGIEDEEIFKKTLEVACELSLIRTSKLNSMFSIHSLLWRFTCSMDEQDDLLC